MTLQDIKAALRNGKYAWPGGYPLYFVTTEGEALSFDAVRSNWREVCYAHIVMGAARCGWKIEGVDTNWEDSQLFCTETGKRIESAYAEDEADQLASEG